MSKLNRYLLREYGRETLRCVVAGLLHFSGYLRLRGKLSGRRAIRILMYHRVSRTSVDSMTIHPKKFEGQIRYVRQRFRVAKLSQILDLIENQQEFPPDTVAITFDDGYQDNFTVAAPILAKYGVPACFFVTSDLMGTSKPFEHDERAGVQFPMMTWEELCDLLAQGHEIGSHSASHSNLAALNGTRLAHEVIGSKRKIEEKSGVEVALFAPPFGYRKHVTQSVVALAKKAGYRCCCYAYGGVNTERTDPYHIRRRPVTPSWSSFVFRRMLEGAFDFSIFEK